MSIPRLAIDGRVLRARRSGAVGLRGPISPGGRPVDRMPDVTYPTITVPVGYGGVGPQEIEQLIVRPLEQSLAAVPGLEQMNSTASEGSGTVRLNFAWGVDLNDAADEVRTRMDRVRGRLPTEADPPSISKFDASAQPIMTVGVESDKYDRVTLRELAENDLGRRLERVEGVASVTVDGGLRRQVRVELSKEKITALDLSVDRVINVIRTENQNVPLGEIIEGDTNFLLRSQSEFQSVDQIRDLVVLTKAGVPIYLRDIADVKDATEDLRSFLRINGKAGVRLRVSKQSGKNTVAIAEGVRKEVERTNREVPSVHLTLIDDIRARNLDSEVSVKLTQLGYDLDVERTLAHAARIAEKAAESGMTFWIDMEGSAYAEGTIAFYERLKAMHPNVGLCLQSYLHRTAADVQRLLPIDPKIRLVKGAYAEPATIAYQSKHDVDSNYVALSVAMLEGARAGRDVMLGLGTHDVRLIDQIAEHAQAMGMPRTSFEVQMLYGIRVDQQRRYAREGYLVRALISYGEAWYPWYMRRLAERPANLTFVVRNILRR